MHNVHITNPCMHFQSRWPYPVARLNSWEAQKINGEASYGSSRHCCKGLDSFTVFLHSPVRSLPVHCTALTAGNLPAVRAVQGTSRGTHWSCDPTMHCSLFIMHWNCRHPLLYQDKLIIKAMTPHSRNGAKANRKRLCNSLARGSGQHRLTMQLRMRALSATFVTLGG